MESRNTHCISGCNVHSHSACLLPASLLSSSGLRGALAFVRSLLTKSVFSLIPASHSVLCPPHLPYAFLLAKCVRQRSATWKCPRQEVQLQNKAMVMLYEFYRDGKKFYICPVPKAGCDFHAEWSCFWEVIDLDSPSLQQSKAKATNDATLTVGKKTCCLQACLWVGTKLGSAELTPSGTLTFLVSLNIFISLLMRFSG